MTNLKSERSRRRGLRFLPTPRDRHVLEAVAEHGRLTRSQIQRLFFLHQNATQVSAQAVNARLKKLTDMDLLDPVVVSTGRGGGPYAYALGSRAARLLARSSTPSRRTGPVWHQLEIGEFRVRLQEALGVAGGALVEWRGEPMLRSLLVGRRGWPVPDALVHWWVPSREGTFLLEWDRGSEALAVVVAKLNRYRTYWRSRGHRELLPGLGLRPRLAIVVRSETRRRRVIQWLEEKPPLPSTVLIGTAADVLRDPLGVVWWRSDRRAEGSLADGPA